MSPSSTVGARALLPAFVGRDAALSTVERVVPARGAVADDALDLAIDWLCRTHDVTGRRGSSKGFSLLHGWFPAYPETTGYVLGTLMEYSRRRGGRDDLLERARQMGDWEAEIQEPDGGIMEGHVETRPRRSIVFNTGQVLHGWVDLLEAGHGTYGVPAERAAAFLVDNLRPDGTWRDEVEYSGLPHTYNSRVAWAMVRFGAHTGADDVTAAAARQLDWVCDQQNDVGWFDKNVFKLGTTPSTHAIAYTLRGLLESAAITGNERWLNAAVRGSETLIRKLEVLPRLLANYAPDWTPTSTHSCLTGTVQLGGVWLRLHDLTGDARFLNAGLKAVEQGAARQQRIGSADVRGALAGSYPIWGRYAPLQYPNWATKFMADSLMMREDALSALAA
jgi:hypothetical protein